MMSSVRKTLKTLVWLAQTRFLRNLPENNHKIYHLFTDCFPAKFTLKIPVKSTDFSAILSPKIPQNLTFFSMNYQKPCIPDFHFLNADFILDCWLQTGFFQSFLDNWKCFSIKLQGPKWTKENFKDFQGLEKGL